MNRPSTGSIQGNLRPAVRWILHSTRDLVAPLLLASVLACCTRLAALGIYYVAALGLAQAAGLPVTLPGAGLGYPALAGWLVALALAKGGLRYAEQFTGHKVAFLALARLRTRIYADYERQAPFPAGAHSGAMLQRAVRDIDRVEVFFAHTLPPAVAALVLSTLVAVWAMATVQLAGGLILLAGYLLLGALVPLLGLGTIGRAAAEETAARRLTSARIADTLSGAGVVFSLDAQRAMAARLEPDAHPSPGAGRASWTLGLRSALVGLVPWISALLILLAGARNVEPGPLLVLLVLAVPSFEAVRAVDGFVGSLQESLHSIERLYANHQMPPPVAEPRHPLPPGTSHTGLVVRDLQVVRDRNTVVRHLDFHVAPGSRVGMVGSSGSGKSSVAAALVRALPCTGRVTLDSVDTAHLAQQQLRERLVLVAQDDSLIRGTLRENLALGREDLDDALLVSTLEEVGLGPWFKTQRAGLDTRLGERGARISGGQRQRLVLVRALLRSPRILLLDEATSALDTHTEAQVLDALQRRVAQGMGLVMISHRLAVLEEFETVLVLEDGQVRERGSARQLLADSGSLFHLMRRRELESIDAESGR
ncbi:ABC transporter ATP-binding protein/permease [Glutamicibacter sp. MNS18]|uniref:ATP-binding cassette domain-containing protein n=1 Tax=Glutamicibacter sp. MNS18 TaxID=2989817 RepID=UPI0022359D15|nr:ABC transporter ATP-binding protein [Glutamicibacter sp. MNS18]MCW4467079.1 ABC transporter ATP-binding protein/permease [Glutamicibacter sp. MNS18]